MAISISQYFSSSDYLLSLPIVLLTLFALGILLIDLILPAEWKRFNAVIALIGLGFSAAGVIKIQWAFQRAGESPFIPASSAAC